VLHEQAHQLDVAVLRRQVKRQGTLSGGQHINYPDNTPMANLLLTMLDKAGVPTPDKIGDSTEQPSI
jgi:hypothetical protein